MARVLAFSGSTRRDSFNRKLISAAAAALRDRGVDVMLVNLADYPMPIYNGDLEASDGLPENARRLRELARERDGYLISSPEYNSSFTPLLKNTLDWMSRNEQGQGSLDVYHGKTAALLGASNGQLGALRSILQLRWMLENIGVLVLPNVVAVSKAASAFGPGGELTDPTAIKRVQAQADAYAELLSKLTGASLRAA